MQLRNHGVLKVYKSEIKQAHFKPVGEYFSVEPKTSSCEG